jgi:hypothetical protein
MSIPRHALCLSRRANLAKCIPTRGTPVGARRLSRHPSAERVKVQNLSPLREACPDETTDRATSHLTNPAKDAGQVIGYSHSTRLSAEELLAGHPKDDSQVASYEPDKTTSHPTKQSKDGLPSGWLCRRATGAFWLSETRRC